MSNLSIRRRLPAAAQVILLALSWIIGVNTLAYYLASRDVHQNRETIMLLEPELLAASFQADNFLSAHLRWDAFWYLHTAKAGYFVDHENQLSNVAFFPLYPALVNLLSRILLGQVVLAAWLLSNLSLLGTCLLLYYYTRRFHPALNPWRPLFFLLFFPTAFFLTTLYTESLFLFLTLSVFYLMRRHNFIPAAFLGILAALTRPPGFLLFIPLLVEYFSLYGSAGLSKPKWLLFLLPPASFLGYLVFLKIKFQDPWLFFKVQPWFNRHPLRLPEDLLSLVLGLILVFFVLLVIFYAWRRLRHSYALYSLALLAAPLSSLSFLSLSRIILTIFPVFLVLASVKNKPLLLAWFIFAPAMLLSHIILYVSGLWAG
jgi:hypothetical protein